MTCGHADMRTCGHADMRAAGTGTGMTHRHAQTHADTHDTRDAHSGHMHRHAGT